MFCLEKRRECQLKPKETCMQKATKEKKDFDSYSKETN